MRLTIRLRLTLLYGGMFLLAGAVLLALNYALVRTGIDRRLGQPTRVLVGPSEAPFISPMVGFPTEQDQQRLRAVIRRAENNARDRALHELLVQSGLALGVMSLASVGLGYVVAGRALRPLHEITAAARRLGEQNLHERIALRGPEDELKELADTFDGMLARLDAAFESQRRFVANASHELRTPLAVMRAEVDVALAAADGSPESLRSMARSVRAAVTRCERLVDSLLVLARSDRGVSVRSSVDVGALAGEVVTQLAGEAARRTVTLSSSLTPAAVSGDPALLDRLVANLVENALRHNVAGGWASVSVAAATGSWVRLTVANSGPAVAPEEVPRLFEPFGRGAARGGDGVGLGLSIVRSIARAHGGSVSAQARDEGGLEVVVTLPLAAEPAVLQPA